MTAAHFDRVALVDGDVRARVVFDGRGEPIRMATILSRTFALVACAPLAFAGCTNDAPSAARGSSSSSSSNAPGSVTVAASAPPSSSASPSVARYTAPPCTYAPLELPLVRPDGAILARLEQIAKCPSDTSQSCEALDGVVAEAKKLGSLPETSANDTTIAGAASAYVAALEHESPRVRHAGADALHEVAHAIKNHTVVPRLLDRVEIESDADAKRAMASALGKLGTYESGHHCRAIAMIRKMSKSDPTAGDLVASLNHPTMKETPDAIFDFAYELLLGDSPGPVNGRAIELLGKPSAARKAEACERLREAIRIGVRGWGSASTKVWQIPGCGRDVVVPMLVAKLRTLAGVTRYDVQLSNDVAFLEDFARWPGVTIEQKKSACDAAGTLAKDAKDVDAKKSGEKILAICKAALAPG